jgi:hypothetical protein
VVTATGARKSGAPGVPESRVSAEKKAANSRRLKIYGLRKLLELLPDPNIEAFADEPLTVYARSLLLRLSEALPIPRRAVEVNDWTPTPNDCHGNAEEWVRMNQGWMNVHGWLVADLRSSHDYVDLLPHSVVRSPSGELVDITPPPPEAPPSLAIFPFLIHIGEAKEFRRFVANYPVAHLRVRGEAAVVSFFTE